MLEVKYKSKPIGEMHDSDVTKWGKALLLKIHVITGWTIPASPELANILIDQFTKHLQEKYYSLNPDEIEFAFRQDGTTTEDWGKAFNLNLVDKVLMPYKNQRLVISETERQLDWYKSRPEFSLERDIDYRKQVEEDYQVFLGGRFRLTIFPEGYYTVLEQDRFFPKGWWQDRYQDYRKRYPEYDNLNQLISVAKDRCVLQVFRTARQRGYLNLYTKP